jgi:hypothetical protein
MSITPSAEVPPLSYLSIVILDVVFNWEARRIVDSHVAPESKKNAWDLKRQRFRVGSKVMSSDIDDPTTKKPQKTIETTDGHTACVAARENKHSQLLTRSLNVITRHLWGRR